MAENRDAGRPQRFCTSCGSEAKANNAFCTSCGTTLTSPRGHSSSSGADPLREREAAPPGSQLRTRVEDVFGRLSRTVSGVAKVRPLWESSDRRSKPLALSAAVALVGLAVLALLALLYPRVTLVFALVALVASLIVLIVRIVQRRSLIGWGTATALSLVFTFAVASVAGVLDDDDSGTTDKASRPERGETSIRRQPTEARYDCRPAENYFGSIPDSIPPYEVVGSEEYTTPSGARLMSVTAYVSPTANGAPWVVDEIAMQTEEYDGAKIVVGSPSVGYEETTFVANTPAGESALGITEENYTGDTGSCKYAAYGP